MVLWLQVLALFNKAIRKLHALLRASAAAAVERSLPAPQRPAAGTLQPHAVGLDEDLDQAAKVERDKLREK